MNPLLHIWVSRKGVMAEYSNIWADGDDGGITADCKSVTLETLLVRIQLCSLGANSNISKHVDESVK